MKNTCALHGRKGAAVTSVIDNSLCFLTINDGIIAGSGEYVVDYAKRLLMTGVDYIQIDNRSVEYFNASDFPCGKRCLFRVRCPEDTETALKYDFAYITVPIFMYLEYTAYKEILPINLEISSYDGMSLPELYKISRNVTRFSDISMFTFVVGDSSDRREFSEILADIRKFSIASVAICPLNVCCCGADIATDAFSSGANAVYLSHVSGGRYTTLSEFINSACRHFRISVDDKGLDSVMNAAAGIISLERKIKEGVSILPNFNVDEGNNFKHVRPERPAGRKPDGVERKLREFEFESDEAAALRKILGELTPDLYRNNNEQ